MKTNNSYSFLVIGKSQESTETQEFKRYVGVGSSFVLAVNPTKKELEDIYGRILDYDLEYVVDTDRGREARVTFIVKTDPAVNDGIEIINRVMFVLRNEPAYSKDKSKVQVIDKFGNSTWGNADDVKAGKKLVNNNGQEQKIGSQYRIACVGEADLVAFLKTYLGVGDAFNYTNGSWIMKDNTDDFVFGLEHIKDYFSGDFSELKEALALQPHNKVKLLYGVRTTDEGKQYQTVAARNGMVLPNSAGSNAMIRLEKSLARAKDAGSYANTEFRVQPLAEYDVKPSDLSSSVASATPAAEAHAGSEMDMEMPW